MTTGENYFCGVSSSVIVILFSAFHSQCSSFTDTYINWRHLCHAQGDIPIDPYTSISYPRTSPPSRKNILKSTDSSLISDLATHSHHRRIKGEGDSFFFSECDCNCLVADLAGSSHDVALVTLCQLRT